MAVFLQFSTRHPNRTNAGISFWGDLGQVRAKSTTLERCPGESRAKTKRSWATSAMLDIETGQLSWGQRRPISGEPDDPSDEGQICPQLYSLRHVGLELSPVEVCASGSQLKCSSVDIVAVAVPRGEDASPTPQELWRTCLHRDMRPACNPTAKAKCMAKLGPMPRKAARRMPTIWATSPAAIDKAAIDETLALRKQSQSRRVS